MILPILPLLLGCDVPQFHEEWELDRLRLLAVRAEPAEPRPGDVVSFTSLRFVPDDAEWSASWIACVDGDTEGCTIDEDLLSQLEHADELSDAELLALFAALQAAGFVGVEPGMPLGWIVPTDALDGLDDAERLEGRSATVTINLATEDDAELVLKSIPVSEATTPNHNPDLTPLTFDGVPVVEGTRLVVDRINNLDVGVALDGEPETYEYVTTAGEAETRTEAPSFRWYVSGGVLTSAEAGFSIGDDGSTESEMVWTTPDEPGVYTLAAVVLDGRGGMGWRSLEVEVD